MVPVFPSHGPQADAPAALVRLGSPPSASPPLLGPLQGLYPGLEFLGFFILPFLLYSPKAGVHELIGHGRPPRVEVAREHALGEVLEERLNALRLPLGPSATAALAALKRPPATRLLVVGVVVPAPLCFGHSFGLAPGARRGDAGTPAHSLGLPPVQLGLDYIPARHFHVRCSLRSTANICSSLLVFTATSKLHH